MLKVYELDSGSRVGFWEDGSSSRTYDFFAAARLPVNLVARAILVFEAQVVEAGRRGCDLRASCIGCLGRLVVVCP